jgi:hypothetical protein
MKRSLAVLLCLAICCKRSPDTSASAPVTVIQTLSTFDRPESCIFTPDGKWLFVGNCGSELFGPDRKKVGFVVGRGAISRLAVGRDGRATMDKADLVVGLNGPLGLGLLPKATARFPQGTLVVNQGLALQVDAQGNSVTDAKKLGTGILFFNPESGKSLGRIDLGIGSAVGQKIGHPVLLPNSVCFDAQGNLYVTDTAKGGDRLDPPLVGYPGLIRIEHAAIDDPSVGSVTFTAIPGVPNGVGYWAARDAIGVVTMGGETPEGEAVYTIPAAAFPLGALPAPYVQKVGTADGIAFTPAGTIVTSRFSGDLLAIPEKGAPRPIHLDPEIVLVSPADHHLMMLPDGSSMLAVPEQARTEPEPGKQRVRLIRLPPGF